MTPNQFFHDLYGKHHEVRGRCNFIRKRESDCSLKCWRGTKRASNTYWILCLVCFYLVVLCRLYKNEQHGESY